MALFATMALGQYNIHGTITDAAEGSVLPGANVVVTGTYKGVFTNANGIYKLREPSNRRLRTFSFLHRL
jgi:TonB-dependent starch-binding outer membrane protein SusC